MAMAASTALAVSRENMKSPFPNICLYAAAG
jgi:hypothetical protein